MKIKFLNESTNNLNDKLDILYDRACDTFGEDLINKIVVECGGPTPEENQDSWWTDSLDAEKFYHRLTELFLNKMLNYEDFEDASDMDTFAYDCVAEEYGLPTTDDLDSLGYVYDPQKVWTKFRNKITHTSSLTLKDESLNEDAQSIQLFNKLSDDLYDFEDSHGINNSYNLSTIRHKYLTQLVQSISNKITKSISPYYIDKISDIVLAYSDEGKKSLLSREDLKNLEDIVHGNANGFNFSKTKSLVLKALQNAIDEASSHRPYSGNSESDMVSRIDNLTNLKDFIETVSVH